MVLKYRLAYTKKGLKGLRKLSSPDAKKILEKMKALTDFSSKTANIKKMVGMNESIYRLRVGNMRAVFEVDKKESLIVIIDVGYRGGIYDDM